MALWRPLPATVVAAQPASQARPRPGEGGTRRVLAEVSVRAGAASVPLLLRCPFGLLRCSGVGAAWSRWRAWLAGCGATTVALAVSAAVALAWGAAVAPAGRALGQIFLVGVANVGGIR